MTFAVRLILLLGVLCLAPVSGAAQTIQIRSGEHTGYSRIVVEFRGAPDWRLTKVPGGYVLRTDAGVEGFDTAGVFRRIPRTRLADIAHQPGTGNLMLSLACRCEVSAFELERGAIVIDIGDPRRRAAASARASEVAPALSGPRPRARPARGVDVAFDGPIRLLRGAVDDTAVKVPTPEPGIVLPPTRQAATGPPLPDTAPDLSPAAELLTRSLAREIARAATQGLVETRRSGTPEAFAPPLTELEGPNIRIETAHDRVFGLPSELSETLSSNSVCRPAAEFDVGSWGDDRPAGTQISEARLRLVGELEGVDPGAAIDLARLYIYLSFGVEAERVLASIGADVPGADTLAEFARLMDEEDPPGGILASQISCGSVAVLWATLALPELPSNEIIDKDAILLTFSGLPAHLRRHLGPRLASRFAAANDIASVEAVTNAVGRVAPEADPSYALTRGQIAIADTGRVTGAERELSDIASGRHPDAPDALLLLIESHAERGTVVPRHIIDTADIMTFELEGTVLGEALENATIRARLTRGEFREAFQGLARAEEGTAGAPEGFGDLKREALIALVRNSPDAAFMRRILDPAAFEFALASGRAVRFELAVRLLDLGFPAEAGQIAPPDSEATSAKELDYAARLSLALGAPGRAVEFARRSGSPASAQIEARALAEAGRYHAAADLLRRMGEIPDSLQMSWRAQDWQRLSTDGKGPDRIAALAYLGSERGAPFPTPPSLAAAEERLGTAEELRGIVDTVLDAYPAPDP